MNSIRFPETNIPSCPHCNGGFRNVQMIGGPGMGREICPYCNGGGNYLPRVNAKRLDRVERIIVKNGENVRRLMEEIEERQRLGLI